MAVARRTATLSILRIILNYRTTHRWSEADTPFDLAFAYVGRWMTAPRGRISTGDLLLRAASPRSWIPTTNLCSTDLEIPCPRRSSPSNDIAERFCFSRWVIHRHRFERWAAAPRNSASIRASLVFRLTR